MPNDNLKKYYDYLKTNGADVAPDYNKFVSALSDEGNAKKYHSYLLENGFDAPSDYSVFANRLGLVKKKEVSQSTQNGGGISSAISKTVQKQPSVSSVAKKPKGEIYTDDNGVQFQYKNNTWNKIGDIYKDTGETQVSGQPGNQQRVPILKKEEGWKKLEDRNQIKKLNYQFNKDVSLDPIDQVYSNYDEEKKDNEYRISNGNWQRKVPGAESWTTITNEGSISGLNRRYGKDVKYNPELKPTKSEPKLQFADVNTSLVAKTEEKAVDILDKKYGKYGFTFEQTGIGTDYVTVYNKDKTKEITVGFDEKNPEEALKLKNFLEQNASKENSYAYNKIQNKKDVTRDFENISALGNGSEKMKQAQEKREKELSDYLDSEEYNNDFKSLSYNEMKDEIKDRITRLQRWRQTDPKMQSDIDKFYKTEAYKIFKEKKKEEFGARDAKIDLLYTELQTAKASGNKTAQKDIKSKITTYLTDDIIQDQVKNYSIQLNDLDNAAKKLSIDQKKYLQSVEDFNKKSQSGQISQEEFNQTKKMLDDQAEALDTRADNLMSSGKLIQKNQRKLNVVAGKYVAEKAKAGSFGGGLVNSFLTGVSKSLVELPLTVVASSESSKRYNYNMLSPEEKQYYKDKGYSEQQTKNILANERLKKIKNESRKALIDIAGADQTTQEYMKSSDRGFFEKAIYGVAESAPAMLSASAGATASFAGLAAQSYSSIEDEMLDDPDFATSSAEERAVVSVPYSLAMGVLENYGLKNVVKGQSLTGSLIKKIVATSVSKMPKNASQKVLQSIIDKEVKNLIAKGTLKIVNGAIAEFETGATQSLVLDVGLKSLYNKLVQSGMTEEEVKNLSGGELFTTPDTLGEVTSTVLEDGLAEAIGGATIGTFATVATGLKNGNISLYDEKDLDYLKEISQDTEFKKLIVTNLKTEMLRGSLTKSEAQEKLDAMNELSSVMQSIPEDLDAQDQIDAVNMLSEKNRLTREIQGKDPALVTAQTDRINEINDELKNISKNAVKESTKPVEEVTAEGGGLQREGVNEGQSEIREGEGTVGETAQPETDLGNRPIEGGGIQEEVAAPKVELTKEEKQRNRIVSLQQEYNGLNSRQQRGKQGSEIKQSILNLASSLDYTIGEQKGKITITNQQGKKVVRTAYKEEIAEQPEYEVQIAKTAIDNGVLNWSGDPLDMRWDSQLSWTDIRKGQKDISEGKYTTQPAKRLIIELNNQYKSGGFNFMQGAGKHINRTGIPISQAFKEETIVPIPPEAEQAMIEQRAAEEEQFVASEMIQEKTNLGRVYDYLDKLDKILDETLSPDKLNDITRVLPAAVMKVVVKALKVSVQAGMTLEQAIKDYAQKNNMEEKQITDSLYNMTDYQNKKTRERVTGEKQPTVKVSKEAKEAKEIAKPKVTKVTVNEMSALKDQIRLEARAARDAKGDLNAKRKALSAAISDMVKTGKIKATQAATLIKRISNLNLDNPVMVERFVNYAERVFERADYQETLSKAFDLRKSIRKALKTDNQAEVVGMAKEFTKIDPSMVKDIDAYIVMAEKVKNAVKPSVAKLPVPVLKQAASIAEISEYSKNEIERQEQIKIDEFFAAYNEVEGLSKDMSLKEMKDIINSLKEKEDANPDKQEKVMEFLKEKMSKMSETLKSMFKDGVDPMTGEEITFDENQKDLMKRAIKIDLNEMKIREAIKIVESIDNFLTNQITSGLEAAVSSYEGTMNTKTLVARGKVARPLRLFGNKYIGETYSEQLFSLPNLLEKMFGGVMNSLDVMRKMGLLDLINGVNKANRQHNDIIDAYTKQPFYSTKNALGRYVMNKGFMDAKNVYERAILAELKRSVIGTEAEMKADFENRVKILKDSIDLLIEEGNSKEKKMGELYKEVYDKLNVESMDMSIIESNASDNNLASVNWWINEWAKHRSKLFDVSLSVYNTMLTADLNYTTRTLKQLSSKDKGLDENLVNQNGAFTASLNNIDKNKSGVLMETTGKRQPTQYISLDFDNNNSKALKAALVDINTASAIRQVDGFMKSKAFNKLIPDGDDREIIDRRISTYIKRAKGKNVVPRDTIQYLNKFISYITSLGVGKALAGINQTVMQTTPVMINTLANAGRFDLADAKFNAWLDKTGMPIANRGLESQSTVESIDKKLEAKGQTTQEVFKAIAEINQWYLKQLLVKPDVFVARSSFKSYYLQNLKRRGISTDIDWTTHEMDKEAAEYAQIMIDRQQNISDPLLAGEFLASENPYVQMTRKIFLPFASFILNQKARMYNDIQTIASKTASSEDKSIAWRSIGGLSAELLTYQLLGFGIKRLYDSIAAGLLGDEEDEEKKKKRVINATKLPLKNIVNDIVSPIPLTDDIITWGLNKSLAQYPWMDEKEIKEAVKNRNKLLALKGEDEMTSDQEAEFIDKIKKEALYQVYSNDQNERAYGMIGIAGDTYKELGEVGKLAATGEFEDDYQGRITKKVLLESDRKDVGVAVLPMLLYSTGLLPKDFGTISRKYVDRIKEKAITEKQYQRYEDVQKDLGRNLKSWEVQLVKDKKESETAIDEIKFIERNGGLTERQGREYLKLMKAIGEPSVSDLTKIKDGQTADQILK